MLYSAKMKTIHNEYYRESITAKNYEDACIKAKDRLRDNDYYAEILGVFLVGSKEDKQGYYSDDD